MEKQIKKFLKHLKIDKIDYDLAKTALSHPSYTKEQGVGKEYSYERLEFLGDAVLKLASSKVLFEKYPDFNEGKLTQIRSYLVSDKTLADFASEMKLFDVILLSTAEEKNGGRNKKMILACVFESLLGAIFLTYGFEFCEKFLLKIYKKKIKEIVENLDKFNPKANLQEFLQKRKQPLPKYRLVKEVGPAHNKTFECEVTIGNRELATGVGATKKNAEEIAAQRALKILEKEISDEQ